MHALLEMSPQHAQVAPAIQDALARVEQRFAEHAKSDVRTMDVLCTHVERYRGKMLRPMLVALSGMACGKLSATDAHITVGAVVEMIHMATLVHDDVLDDAVTRRGGPTINHEQGNIAAVVLGDYLFARSFHLCSTLESQRTSMRIGEITATVCEGEMLQNASAGDFGLSEDTYFDIIHRKTAALIAVACELGAHHAGADEATSRRFFDFGAKLGSAFQIQDDLLDLVGDERVVGKTLGRDLAKGKATLPVIHHLASLEPGARAAAAARLSRGQSPTPGSLSIVPDLERTGSIVYARGVASSLVAEARALLAPLPDTGAKASLEAMAAAVITRAF